jgi:hypothetical protein
MAPERVPPPGFSDTTVEKRKRRGRVVEIRVRLGFGTMAAALGLSRSSPRANVSSLERYRATDRHKNARGGRRTYTFSKDGRVHESLTYSTMVRENFC